MLRRNYSLILMAIWLFIGLCLVFPDQILPEKTQKYLRGAGGVVGGVGILAFVFAAYNLARWWAFQSVYRNRKLAQQVNPLAAHEHPYKPEPEFEEPNPELDFLKLPDADKPAIPPTPSANGDHKDVNLS